MQIFRYFGLKKPSEKFKARLTAIRVKMRAFAAGLLRAARRAGRTCANAKPKDAVKALRRTAARLRALEREQKKQIARQAVALAVMACVTVGSVAAVVASAKRAQVVFDGKAGPTVEIESNSTGDILRQAGVAAHPGDLVTRRDARSGDISISVKTLRNTEISADGKQYAASVHYGDTVANALAQAGITLAAQDEVTPSASAPVENGMDILVKRRFHITVTADGQTIPAIVDEGTVTGALAQAGVTMQAEDGTDVDPAAAVREGMKIAVSRVTYRDVTQTVAVPFQTVTQKDGTLAAGTLAVGTDGRNGSKTVVTRQKLCNGKVIGSSVVSATVTAQPVDKITRIGTQHPAGTAAVCADGTLIDQNGDIVDYSRMISGRCSGYTGGGTTSTGRAAAFGLVAVNPHLIPYGTRLYICSPDGGLIYGYAIAADTGGAAMSGTIVADLYYDTYSQCMRIGSRRMNVYLLK